MTSTVVQNGPEQETAPAFVVAPQRLQEVDLTWRDALVWEQLPRELVGWDKFGLFAIFAALGMLLALTTDSLPVWFANLPYWAQVLVTVPFGFLIHVFLLNLRKRISARRRFPNPLRVATEVLPDRIRQSWEGGGLVQLIGDTRQTVVTPSHVFLDSAQSLLILPLACFDGPKAMADFAESWETASLGLSDAKDMELPVRP